MLKKFIRIVRNKKSFSIVEVIVAIFITSIAVFSVVETYRYIFLSSVKTKDFSVMINSVNKVYNGISLGIIDFKGNLNTNVDGVEIIVKTTNFLQEKPFIGDIIIYATNKDLSFSVITSLY